VIQTMIGYRMTTRKFQRILTADTPSDWIALMAIAVRRKSVGAGGGCRSCDRRLRSLLLAGE